MFSKYPQCVRDDFWAWKISNPEIYAEFVSKAMEMKRQGRKKYSARTIVEVIRWNSDSKKGAEPFKINDDYVPMMSRLLMSEWPEFEGFFELREVRSKGIKSQEQRKRETA